MSLTALLNKASKLALEAGSLVPLDTQTHLLREGPIEFIVHVAASLSKKPTNLEAKALDPFLPYDPNMFVKDVSETHVALLNKYPVVHNHFLLATKEFEKQTDPLNRHDFTAIWSCLQEQPLLVFFNCGDQSGASQPHKHIQIAPLPLSSTRVLLPIEHLIPNTQTPGEIFEVAEFPFQHACVIVERFKTNEATVLSLLSSYDDMMNHLRLYTTAAENPASRSYNLLLTQRWMLIVPRSKSDYGPVSVNSFGFCGTLLVKTQQALEFVQSTGPLRILTEVAFERTISEQKL